MFIVVLFVCGTSCWYIYLLCVLINDDVQFLSFEYRSFKNNHVREDEGEAWCVCTNAAASVCPLATCT